jgi:GntR family transcriptional repressor for pyruvate dehydrogenase complex
MGVSRPSLREAISALHIVGLLESRPGDGTYVCAAAPTEDRMHQALHVLEECDSPFEHMHARKALEIGAVRLVVQVATEADLLDIQNAWKEKCERARRGDLEEYLSFGKEFHIAIARATRNRVIEAITEKLLEMTKQPLWTTMRRDYFRKDPSRVDLMIDIHDRIMKALLERNTEKTILELERHYDIQILQIYEQNDGTHRDEHP